MKRKIRLTESELHRIIKESVKRIIKENENYLFPNGSFDSFAYDYDKALETANSEEEWDEMMRRRKEYNDLIGRTSQDLHPQVKHRTYGSLGSSQYVNPQKFGINPDDIDDELEKGVKRGKYIQGFPI